MTTSKVKEWLDGGWKQSKYARVENGKLGLDTDGLYGFQCKDGSNAYAEFIGHSFTAGNAEALWTRDQGSFWKRVEPTENPKAGDVFVAWYASGGIEYGHTGVVMADGTPSNFTSLDQNWLNSSLTIGSPPAVIHHVNLRVRGFLRPQLEGDEIVPETSPPVFNADFYLQTHKDVAAVCPAGMKPQDFARLHWTNNGISEGRISAQNFSVNEYRANYSDLAKNYPTDNLGLIKHYYLYGINEGRQGRTIHPDPQIATLTSQVDQLTKAVAVKDNVIADDEKQIVALKAQMGNATKWETITALLKQILGIK